jgi:lipoate---protein ligase
MGLDQWLFQQCASGQHPPVLRFYTWSPPAISLGKNQHRWPQHWQQLVWQQQPVALVRRPSGGRAVLHQGDLTYLLVVNHQSGNRRQAYRSLCEFLIQGWRALGVTLDFGGAGRSYLDQPNCFAIATDADLVLSEGTKLIGSAQAWQGTTVLQHGSMRLQPDPELYAQVFGIDATGEDFAFIEKITHEMVIQSLMQAAEKCFQIQLCVQPLSASEWDAIATIAAGTPLMARRD